jgi:spore germination cell wall hydrolase CwlJ-like protein
MVRAVVSAPLTQPTMPTNIFTQPAAVAPQMVALSALVASQAVEPLVDEESKCLATAVYFESMGEPLEGQLAVAQVVINRSQSGRYPSSWCGVVKQKAQFSFVRAGRFPRIDPGCEAWRKAQAIARIAAAKMAYTLPTDVLWYHADYVAPGWGKRLTRVEKIGAHIFYRA